MLTWRPQALMAMFAAGAMLAAGVLGLAIEARAQGYYPYYPVQQPGWTNPVQPNRVTTANPTPYYATPYYGNPYYGVNPYYGNQAPHYSNTGIGGGIGVGSIHGGSPIITGGAPGYYNSGNVHQQMSGPGGNQTAYGGIQSRP